MSGTHCRSSCHGPLARRPDLADRIDLRLIDARGGVAGDQAFRFIGDDPLAGGGELRFAFAGTSTVVQGSTDADAAPEFEVQLAGRIGLGADDFLL